MKAQGPGLSKKTKKTLNAAELTELVLEVLKQVLIQNGQPVRVLDAATPLMGGQSLLDSLGLVTFIVHLEQRLHRDYGISITLANERAMSQKTSPFRTAKSLTEFIQQSIHTANGKS